VSKYLMTLNPQEMYFFGNEKSFIYPDKSSKTTIHRYYIKSEHSPAQTTLLGVLRYVLLPNKKEYRKYTETEIAQNNAVVGDRSFCFGENNTFGKIKNLSPLFLLKDGEHLIPTPFDHIHGNATYTPFQTYHESLDGEFIYPKDYNAKEGLSQSYTSVESLKIFKYSDIFFTETRTGINCSSSKQSFFKKEYAGLKEGFAFACFVTLEDDITPENTIAFLGQGKSLFTISFTKVRDDEENILYEKISSILRPDITYCFGDAFLNSDCYKETKFAITDFKDYRSYTTAYAKSENSKVSEHYKSIKKGGVLFKLVRAGSVFISKNNSKKLFSDTYINPIGFNTFINGGIGK